MAAETAVDLSGPIQGHGKSYNQVVVREPTARDFIELGQPEYVIFGPNNQATQHEDNGIIEQYLRRCIREPNADIVFAQINLRDAIALRTALLGFFIAARAGAMVDGSKPNGISETAPKH
jgi:hypothetical protein